MVYGTRMPFMNASKGPPVAGVACRLGQLGPRRSGLGGRRQMAGVWPV